VQELRRRRQVGCGERTAAPDRSLVSTHRYEWAKVYKHLDT
jgi:hypothetical protein